EKNEKHEVEFNASATDPEGDPIILYEWLFGDGAGAQGKSVKHEYDDTGIFNVVLTVTSVGDDGIERTGSAKTIVKVNQCNKVLLDAPALFVVSSKKKVTVSQEENYHFEQVEDGVDCEPEDFGFDWIFIDDSTVKKEGKSTVHEFESFGKKKIIGTTYYEEQEASSEESILLTDKPIVKEMKPDYKKVFLAGVSVINTYRVKVEWNDNEPKQLEFFNNKNKKVVPASKEGGEADYDMGFDFKSGANGGENVLSVVAVGLDEEGNEQRSGPFTLNPKILSLTGWIGKYISPGEMTKTLLKPNVEYGAKFSFPEPKIKSKVTVPSWIPFLGGIWELVETGIDVSGNLSSSGEGSGRISGSTGYCIACPEPGQPGESIKIIGSAFGNAKWILDAIELVALEFGVTLGAEIVNRLNITDVFPQLKAIASIPFIGSKLLNLLANYVFVQIKFSPELSFILALQESAENWNCSLGLRCEGKGGFTFPVMISLIAEINDNLSAEGYGGGAPEIELTSPAKDKGIIELSKWAATLVIGAKIKAWRFVRAIEKKWAFGFPSGAASLSEEELMNAIYLQEANEGDSYQSEEDSGWQAISREYGSNYNNFTANNSKTINEKAGTTVQTLIENVHENAVPELAYTNGTIAIAYSFDDLSKAEFAGEEISLLIKKGNSWKAPVNVSKNNLMDFTPKTEFIDGDSLLLIWTQQKNEFTSDPGLTEEFISGFEIAYAVLNVNSNTVEAEGTITSNGAPDLDPRIINSNGEINVYWDRYNEDQTITSFFSLMQGNNFSRENELLKLNSLQKSISFSTGNPLIAYIDEETKDLFFGNGFNKALHSRITNDEAIDFNPKLVLLQNTSSLGNGLIVWVKEISESKFELFYSEINNFNPETGKSTGIAFAGQQFDLTEDSKGNAVLLWTELIEGKPELVYAAYDNEFNNWSEMHALTDSINLEGQTSIAFTEKNSVLAAVLETEIELIEFMEREWNFKNVAKPGKKNLIFVEHTYTNDLLFNEEKGIDFSEAPKAGKQVALRAWFKNNGDNTLESVKVELFDELLKQSIETKTFNNVPAGKELEASFAWSPAEGTGNRRVSFILDPENEVEEGNEENNKITRDAFAPEIEIMLLEAANISENNASMKVLIRNKGNAKAEEVLIVGSYLKFYEQDSSKSLAEEKTIGSLEVGEIKEVLLSWNVSELEGDFYDFYVKVLPDRREDLLVEKSRLVELLSNLSAKAEDSLLEENKLKITISNNGVKSTTKTNAIIFDGALDQKRILAEISVDSIEVGEEKELTFSLSDLPSASYFIYLDPENKLIESNESDNLIQLGNPEFFVQSDSEIKKTQTQTFSPGINMEIIIALI
ncbi:MAG TPA: CARDB domain-containing protein, partial [archaeon]|nr:CARDB domain-containing protein [archaeon]